MRLKIWGARGSVPAPGPSTNRYGGNTSCVQVTLSDGSLLILDAGTGIRTAGIEFPPGPARVHMLLTHLHMDHIQGLMFFTPVFDPGSEIVIWGPRWPDTTIADRIARYISAPLAPLELRELPCDLGFSEAPLEPWQIGPATIRAVPVSHRGPTLGYRISDGDRELCYIPDHEPALGSPIEETEDEWLSGLELARGASLLIHDCQYADREYPGRIGWGHSCFSDALAFGRRAAAERMLLFHHDPLHTDAELDQLYAGALETWEGLGGRREQVAMAVEGDELGVGPAAPAASASERAVG